MTVPHQTPTAEDLEMVTEQLGRPVRGVVGIPARCACGAPTVVATKPRLDDGTPFPTFYYLTHPAAVIAASRLESTQAMVDYNAQLTADPELAERYRAAHAAYIRDRDEYGSVPELENVSAGGMPERVKCLHALIAHSLAAGPGVNPIGDLALEHLDWSPTVCSCRREAVSS